MPLQMSNSSGVIASLESSEKRSGMSPWRLHVSKNRFVSSVLLRRGRSCARLFVARCNAQKKFSCCFRQYLPKLCLPVGILWFLTPLSKVSCRARRKIAYQISGLVARLLLSWDLDLDLQQMRDKSKSEKPNKLLLSFITIERRSFWETLSTSSTLKPGACKERPRYFTRAWVWAPAAK